MGSEVIDVLVMDNIEYPNWQKLCQDALVELDKDKLRERIAAAEAAISNRLRIMSSAVESLRNVALLKMRGRFCECSRGKLWVYPAGKERENRTGA